MEPPIQTPYIVTPYYMTVLMKGCDDINPISVSEGIYAQRRM
jgi:hypothetical protein